MSKNIFRPWHVRRAPLGEGNHKGSWSTVGVVIIGAVPTRPTPDSVPVKLSVFQSGQVRRHCDPTPPQAVGSTPLIGRHTCPWSDVMYDVRPNTPTHIISMHLHEKRFS